MGEPVGPDLPPTTYTEFLERLSTYTSESLAVGFTDIFWNAWRNIFPSELANSIGATCAPLLAPFGLARGTGAAPATKADVLSLQFHFLAVGLPSEEISQGFVRALSAAMVGSRAAFLIPDLRTADYAATAFTVSRILSAQWLPARNRLDELTRVNGGTIPS